MRKLHSHLEFDTNGIHTLEKDSPFIITKSDFKALDSKKLGITGHLRVKNEPRTIRLCVESVLPALDELIITCQPHIENGRDFTYEICKELRDKHPKIKLYYYTPYVIPPGGSHVSNKSKEVRQILKRFKNNASVDRPKRKLPPGASIPHNSVHSIAHYYNFGLVKSNFKYYAKIDADHIYLTNKLLELRDCILELDYLAGPQKRSLAKRIFSKLCEPLYAMSARKALKEHMRFCMKINGRCAFSLAGLNIGKINYKNVKRELSKDELKTGYIPLVSKNNSGILLLNGADHNILPLDSDVYYELHPYGVENLIFPNSKHILFLGLMSFHWGHEKRNVKIAHHITKDRKKKHVGVLGVDYVSIDEYLKLDADEVISRTKTRLRFFKTNLRAFKKRDDKFIKEFLQL